MAWVTALAVILGMATVFYMDRVANVILPLGLLFEIWR
jgi:hypothetical protein